jgi:diguanylate cyclase (GGDEF)-like protein
MLEINNKNNRSILPNKYLQYPQKSLLENPQLIQLAEHLFSDAVIIANLDREVIFLNSVAEKITGWQAQEAISLLLTKIFNITNETKYEPIDNPLAELLPTNSQKIETNHAILLTKNSRSFAVEYVSTELYENDGSVTGTIVVFRYVSNSCKLANESSYLADRDSLTKLFNRYSFEEYLKQAVASAKNLEREHILCYLDLDRFKIINESCGHLAGDELLRQISEILQKRVRKTDILARLEGDEFGLLLYQCNLEQALNVVETLREEVQNFQFVWQDKTFNVSLSLGIVGLNTESESFSQLLNFARSACNAAKSKGRNRVQVYHSGDFDLVDRQGEIQWIPRLFKALEQNQFLLYVQPIIPVVSTGKTKRIKSYEVLLRLQDEAGKIVAPGYFIPAAEKYGLMQSIDRWVIRNLFSHLGRNGWQNHNLRSIQNNKSVYTINLSGASLNDDRLLDFIQEEFRLHSIPPEVICFEITETVAISNLNKTTQLINQLKSIGCSFALDDFGSGMSSFGYLKSLPVDYLKIDGIFIKDVLHSQVACEIVEAINRIAHVMEIQTVAEFVENDAILQKLETLAIDYAQGYGISKPYPLS